MIDIKPCLCGCKNIQTRHETMYCPECHKGIDTHCSIRENQILSWNAMISVESGFDGEYEFIQTRRGFTLKKIKQNRNP